jgi:hypothetical protein
MLDVCGTGGKLLPVILRIKTRVQIGIKLIALLALVCGASSCSVQIRKLTTGRSANADTGPFTQSWPFSALSDSSYTFGSSVELSGGVSRLVAATHADSTSGNFASGASSGITYSGSASALVLTHTGTPTNLAEFDESWTPKWSSLVLYAKMNGSGSIANGASIVPTIGGALTALNTNAGGLSYASAKLSTGISFDGVDDSLSLANNLSITRNASQLSLSSWVKLPALANKTYSFFGAALAACSTLSRFGVKLESNASSIYLVRIHNRSTDADATVTSVSPTMIPAGVWTHIAVVADYTAKTQEIYINGVRVFRGTGLAFAANQTDNTDSGCGAIGAEDDSTMTWYSGSADEFGFWKAGLTPSEVATIYSRQSAKYSGTFTSRVMDALAPGQSWTSLAWVSSLPFFKELPDYSGGIQNETSTDYTSLVGSTGATGANDLMTGIVGLWHLDEAAGTSGAASIIDESGQGNHGTPASAVTFGELGRLGKAPVFHGSVNDDISIPDSASLQFDGTKSFTISAWFATTLGNTGGTNSKIISKRDLGVAEFYTLQLGGTTGVADLELGNAVSIAGGADLRDGKWHLMTGVVNRGTNTATLYVDGQQAATSAYAVTNFNTNAFCIGCSMFGNEAFVGSIDEVAIWSRALDPAEVAQLYRRGANRVKHQVRVCTAADCSDDAVGANWKGPDGTRYSYFSELNNNTVALTAAGNVKPGLPTMLFSDFTAPAGTSQYFQYRSILESDDTSTSCDYGSGATWCSPDLKSATIAPTHYDNSSPSIVGKTGVAYTSLSSFTQTLGASCGSGVTYNLGVGASSATATWYWWDTGRAADCVSAGTGAWCTANGTAAKSSTASDINSFASSFGSVVGTGTVYFKAYLGSSGTTACELDNVSLGGVF